MTPAVPPLSAVGFPSWSPTTGNCESADSMISSWRSGLLLRTQDSTVARSRRSGNSETKA